MAALETMLVPLGFAVERITFSEPGTAPVENLYARRGTQGRHLMFAGHTDVVPPGDEAAWRHPPFGAERADGCLYGRGAVDMKGGIACFIAAIARTLERQGPPKGSLSLLITGDEEGPSINGTEKLLQWAHQRGERWDGAIVGEPTNPHALGDMIKIGRRGSLSATLTIHGIQGHVAYPHQADNPLPGLMQLATALMHPPLDDGSENFPPSNLEFTSIDTNNPAVNVIPASVTAAFNIRFNDLWTIESLQAEIQDRLDQAAAKATLRSPASTDGAPIAFELVWRDRPGPSFLTRNDALIATLSAAIKAVTGRQPQLSTTGGTSDARFIKDYCPVVEFGLVGKTMHMVDERVALSDLETLTQIYEHFLATWFE